MTKFSVMSSVTVARFSPAGVAMCNLFPVWWMTSCFPTVGRGLWRRETTALASVSLCVCLSLCPCSKRKTASAIRIGLVKGVGLPVNSIAHFF